MIVPADVPVSGDKANSDGIATTANRLSNKIATPPTNVMIASTKSKPLKMRCWVIRSELLSRHRYGCGVPVAAARRQQVQQIPNRAQEVDAAFLLVWKLGA